MSSASFGPALDPGALYPERRVDPLGALDRWAHGLIGGARRCLPRRLARREGVVAQALAQAGPVAGLADGPLRQELHEAARQLADRRQLARALALVREAARRSLGLHPFGTQLLGAAILLEGRLAEMQTGEGKTLTAGLAAALAACGGAPVHVVTVNDYLAERDAAKLAPLFGFLGLRVGAVLTPMSLPQRREAYGCDIVYCTGKELVFDYLKDKVATRGGRSGAHLAFDQWLDGPAGRAGGGGGTLLRGLHFAIVDEADSIFIDEARTPLILSMNAGRSDDRTVYETAIAIAAGLQRNAHYRLREGTRELELTDHGRSVLAERCLALAPPWNVKLSREHHVAQALRALHLFHRDEHYVLKDEQVQIVDENTGRVLPGRTWEQGLHQMIEVKEGQALSDPARTVARITYQRFFRRYLRLAGMTGTAREVRSELWAVYGLDTVVVPTHRPCVRRLLPPRCLRTVAQKWQAVCDEVQALQRAGRPVLVGTRSVAASQQLSQALAARGVAHRVLNALQDAGEAELIAAAGQPGAVTVATNMAGRGTDIELGPGVAERGGLHVVLTEFHDSQRVDRQLFGRAARQGDPGSARAIVSLEDALFARHAPWLRRAAQGLAETPAVHPLCSLLKRRCQGAVERQNARQRGAATRHDREIENMLSFSGRN